MELPVCKCCGQTLPRPLEFNGIKLSPMQKKLITRVQRAGKFGVTLKMLVDSVYSDDPDGGPLHAERSVHVQLCLANKRLAAAGMRMKADKRGGQGAFYTLVRII